ncbi:MAG: hypothetical protein IH874_01255 [Candidatus Dadabacteria bacterium]|nr:hypothetical protein [Candidatus Dadabacteria bacterium]
MQTIEDEHCAPFHPSRLVPSAYKKALSTERALDILGYEAKDGKLDRELLDVFIEAKIYKLTDKGGA